jgi:hypothetical protein
MKMKLKKKLIMKINKFIWRFLICLYTPFFYISNFLENLLIDNDYADGYNWDFNRTKIDLLKLWYKY